MNWLCLCLQTDIMKYQSPFITLIIVLLLASCGSRESNELFTRAEALMDAHPDSALALLDSATTAKEQYSRSQLMRYELLHAKAQNKAYVDFTSDSIMKDVVEYYDAHGTANEQMEAHYLLGCTYRDLHESPMALSCYLDATERADTLSDECDYAMLMRVYGQIADEFDRQCMPYKELEANARYRDCALRCGDTLSYIIGVLRESNAYNLLGDTLRFISSTKEAARLFKDYGRTTDCLLSMSTLIPYYLNEEDVGKVQPIIDDFEQHSGLFASNGDIAEGYEQYYNSKGKYYLYVNRLDSAEYYFRRLLPFDYDYDAYHGLLDVYLRRNQSDSIRKYSSLLETSLSALHTSLQTQAMFNAEGTFNYTRNQRIAADKEREAERNRSRAMGVTCISAALIVLMLYLFNRYRTKKQHELRDIALRYNRINSEYMQAKEDYELMENDFEAYKAMKAEEINALRADRDSMSKRVEEQKVAAGIRSLAGYNVIAEIKSRNRKVTPGYHSEIYDEEWNAIFDKVKKELPAFHSRIAMNAQLSDQERKIAVFVLLGESTSNISKLLNTSPSNISNAKTSINKKVFNQNQAATLRINMLEMIS